MTNHEKALWLKRYQTESQEIERLTDDIQRWGRLAARVTASFTFGAAAEEQNAMPRALDEMQVLQEKLYQRICQSEAIKSEIEGAIAAVEDARLRELLLFRYISGYTWERMADKMNYCERQLCRMHKTALGAVCCAKAEMSHHVLPEGSKMGLAK